MSDPLIDLTKLLTKKQPYKIGTVLNVNNDKITIQTDSGNTKEIWGSVSVNVGNTVVYQESNIIAKIKDDATQISYVP